MMNCNIKSLTECFGVFLLLVAFFFVGFLVFLYPICSDDYSYAFIHGSGNRVASIGDIFVSECHHYIHQHGRVWTESLTQFFMMFDKIVFNLSLLICYFACAYLIAKFARVRHTLALSVIIPSLWILVPVPGQTMFWLCGACNYIFSTCVMLVFLALLFSEKKWCLVVALPLAVIVGNSHEGTSCGLLVALLLFSLLDRKKKKNPLFYVNIFLLLFGIITIFLSPGTAVRIAHASGNSTGDSFLVKHMVTLARGTWHFCGWIVSMPLEFLLIIALMIGCVVSNVIYKKKKGEIHALALSLAVGAFVNFILPLAANVTYPRAFYGTSTVALISSYIAILPVLVEKKKLLVPLYMALFVANVVTFFVGVNQVSKMSAQEAYVLQALAQGESVICLPENSANVRGRFVEEYDNFNNYRLNGSKAHYIGAQQKYSVLRCPDEIAVWKQCNFDELSEERVHYLDNPNAIIVRLKGPHMRESVTVETETRATLIAHTKSKFLRQVKKIGLPFAAISYKDEYFIIIPHPEKDITLEIVYKDGEKENLHLNPSK